MKIFILILLLLTLGLGFLPFLLNPTIQASLTVSENLIGTIASLTTVLIAILLYSKYGVEKSVLEKQTETVLRFLTELKKTRFLCNSDQTSLQLRLDNLHADYLKKFKKTNYSLTADMRKA